MIILWRNLDEISLIREYLKGKLKLKGGFGCLIIKLDRLSYLDAADGEEMVR